MSFDESELRNVSQATAAAHQGRTLTVPTNWLDSAAARRRVPPLLDAAFRPCLVEVKCLENLWAILQNSLNNRKGFGAFGSQTLCQIRVVVALLDNRPPLSECVVDLKAEYSSRTLFHGTFRE